MKYIYIRSTHTCTADKTAVKGLRFRGGWFAHLGLVQTGTLNPKCAHLSRGEKQNWPLKLNARWIYVRLIVLHCDVDVPDIAVWFRASATDSRCSKEKKKRGFPIETPVEGNAYVSSRLLFCNFKNDLVLSSCIDNVAFHSYLTFTFCNMPRSLKNELQYRVIIFVISNSFCKP